MHLVHISFIFFGINFLFGVIHGEEFDSVSSAEISQVDIAKIEQSSNGVNSDYCLNKYECDVNQTFPVKGCHCDDLCELMDDCCQGFTNNGTPTQSTSLAKSQFACVDMQEFTNNTDFGALIVTKCPSDWEDLESRDLCENSKRKSTYQITSNYIAIDGIMYHNWFCAYCSGAIHRSYDLSTVKLCANYTLINEISTVEHCKSMYYEMTPTFSFRWCPLKEVIGKCMFETTDDVIGNCTAGEYALVYDSLGNVFRNTYCSLCSHVKEEALYCDPLTGDTSVGEPYDFTRLVNLKMDMYFEKVHTHFESHCSSSDYTEMSKNVTMGKNHLSHFKYNKNESGEFLCLTDEAIGIRKPKANGQAGRIYLTIICLIISIFSLTLTLFIYVLIPKLRNVAGKITCCLALSLLLAQLLYLVSSETEKIDWLCVTMAVLVHYFFLAAFCWMNIIAFDLWMTFANHIFDISNTRRICYYSIYAWCVPLIFVGAAIFLNFSETLPSYSPRYGELGCWISSQNALLLLFIVPLALFKVFDMIAFVCTAICIAKTKRESRAATGGRNACSLVLNIKLSLIMGLTWIFAFIANVSDDVIMWYLFIIFNTLQGLFIFICLLCKRRVWKMVSKKYRDSRRKTITHTRNARAINQR